MKSADYLTYEEKQYLQQVRAFPYLSHEEEAICARAWAQNRDKPAREKLCSAHLRFVVSVVCKYTGYGFPFMELVSAGNIGLVEAIDHFDVERGFRLSTLAVWWIRARIQDHIIANWSLVKMGTSSDQKKLFFKLRNERARLKLFDDRNMTDEAIKVIAHRLGVTNEAVRSMSERLKGDESLNAPVGFDDNEKTLERQDLLKDTGASPEDLLAHRDELDIRQQWLAQAVTQLKPREREIFSARRMQDDPLTLEALSDRFAISRERVRQVEVRAYKKVADIVRKLEQEARGEIVLLPPSLPASPVRGRKARTTEFSSHAKLE